MGCHNMVMVVSRSEWPVLLLEHRLKLGQHGGEEFFVVFPFLGTAAVDLASDLGV